MGLTMASQLIPVLGGISLLTSHRHKLDGVTTSIFTIILEMMFYLRGSITYLFLLLSYYLSHSVELKFFSRRDHPIAKEQYYFTQSQSEANYLFNRGVVCTKIVADGQPLWVKRMGEHRPGAVTFFNPDTVHIHFPNKLLVFKNVSGDWKQVSKTEDYDEVKLFVKVARPSSLFSYSTLNAASKNLFPSYKSHQPDFNDMAADANETPLTSQNQDPDNSDGENDDAVDEADSTPEPVDPNQAKSGTDNEDSIEAVDQQATPVSNENEDGADAETESASVKQSVVTTPEANESDDQTKKEGEDGSAQQQPDVNESAGTSADGENESDGATKTATDVDQATDGTATTDPDANGSTVPAQGSTTGADQSPDGSTTANENNEAGKDANDQDPKEESDQAADGTDTSEPADGSGSTPVDPTQTSSAPANEGSGTTDDSDGSSAPTLTSADQTSTQPESQPASTTPPAGSSPESGSASPENGSAGGSDSTQSNPSEGKSTQPTSGGSGPTSGGQGGGTGSGTGTGNQGGSTPANQQSGGSSDSKTVDPSKIPQQLKLYSGDSPNYTEMGANDYDVRDVLGDIDFKFKSDKKCTKVEFDGNEIWKKGDHSLDEPKYVSYNSQDSQIVVSGEKKGVIYKKNNDGNWEYFSTSNYD